jgi:tRNA(Ile)-lysidine synthase
VIAYTKLFSHLVTSDFITLIQKTINDYSLWNFSDRLVVAVSGGPDSIALLHVLYILCPDPETSLFVAHFDHSIHPQSDQVAKFVSSLAQQLKLQIFLEKRISQNIHHESPEAFWRHCRYDFFERIRVQTGATSIAIGHTSDDQVETILLRAVQGTGPRGILGIRIKTETNVIRPLLLSKREEIVSFLNNNRISYVNDPTNDQLHYPRNYIRHYILPHLKELNTHAREHFQSLSELLAQEDQFLAEVTKEYLNKTGWTGKLPAIIDPKILMNCPPSILKRIALTILSDIDQNQKMRTTKNKVANLALFLQSKKGTFHLHGLCDAYQFKKKLHFISPISDHSKFNTSSPVQISIPGTTKFLKFNISATILSNPPLNQDVNNKMQYLSYENAPLFIRTRFPGDRIIPLGHKTSIKLKDYFNRCEIPKEKRNEYPLIVNTQGDILGILGIDATALGRIRHDSTTIVKLVW